MSNSHYTVEAETVMDLLVRIAEAARVLGDGAKWTVYKDGAIILWKGSTGAVLSIKEVKEKDPEDLDLQGKLWPQ